MPALQTISTQVAPDMLARLQEITQNQQCSSSDILKKLLEDYVTSINWLEAKVKKGLEDSKAGHAKPHEEVKRMVHGMVFHVD